MIGFVCVVRSPYLTTAMTWETKPHATVGVAVKYGDLTAPVKGPVKH